MVKTLPMYFSLLRKQYMVIRHLHEYLPLITEEVWAEHFLTVLPVLYEHFQSSHGELTAWSLGCFAQLLKLQPTRMRQYPELTIVNILEVQKGASKLVSVVLQFLTVLSQLRL